MSLHRLGLDNKPHPSVVRLQPKATEQQIKYIQLLLRTKQINHAIKETIEKTIDGGALTKFHAERWIRELKRCRQRDSLSPRDHGITLVTRPNTRLTFGGDDSTSGSLVPNQKESQPEE